MQRIPRLGNPAHMVKVMFELDPNGWHGFASETLWAEKLSGNKYRVENTPFFTHSVSYQDIIKVSENRNKGLKYHSTAIFGGHSTYRILVAQDTSNELFRDYWAPLSKIGCTFESGDFGYLILAVDVPPSTDIHKTFALLEKGETAKVWGFEEGHCGHTTSPR